MTAWWGGKSTKTVAAYKRVEVRGRGTHPVCLRLHTPPANPTPAIPSRSPQHHFIIALALRFPSLSRLSLTYAAEAADLFSFGGRLNSPLVSSTLRRSIRSLYLPPSLAWGSWGTGLGGVLSRDSLDYLLGCKVPEVFPRLEGLELGAEATKGALDVIVGRMSGIKR